VRTRPARAGGCTQRLGEGPQAFRWHELPANRALLGISIDGA
jgi:hypothetical protein